MMFQNSIPKGSASRLRRSGIVLLLLFAIAGFSCAGIQKDIDSADAKHIAGLLQKGDAVALSAMSASPFLLDREILAVPADVEGFWKGVVKAGFALGSVEEDEAVQVSQESVERFATGMEVRTFFKRYVPANARLLSFRTGDGKRVLIVVARDKGEFRIIGFKGPFAI